MELAKVALQHPTLIVGKTMSDEVPAPLELSCSYRVKVALHWRYSSHPTLINSG